MTYTLFGHRDFQISQLPDLYNILESYVNNDSAPLFFIGNEGAFDRHIQSLLKKLKLNFPEIDYHIVLAYMPKPGDSFIEQSIYPESLEKVPKRFAILKRNQWMIDNSDVILYFSERSFGGVATATEYAQKKGKQLISLNRKK